VCTLIRPCKPKHSMGPEIKANMGKNPLRQELLKSLRDSLLNRGLYNKNKSNTVCWLSSTIMWIWQQRDTYVSQGPDQTTGLTGYQLELTKLHTVVLMLFMFMWFYNACKCKSEQFIMKCLSAKEESKTDKHITYDIVHVLKWL